jgi:hypothetical protein
MGGWVRACACARACVGGLCVVVVCGGGGGGGVSDRARVAADGDGNAELSNAKQVDGRRPCVMNTSVAPSLVKQPDRRDRRASPHAAYRTPMEVETLSNAKTRSFQMQNKSLVLSQRHAVTAAPLFATPLLQGHFRAVRASALTLTAFLNEQALVTNQKTTVVGRVSGGWPP